MLWIRIWIHLDPHSFDFLYPDPDPYWECGSGSGRMEIDQNLQIKLVFCLSKRLLYLRMYVFLTNDLLSVYFSSKNSTFCHLKVWPGSGSGSRLDPHWFASRFRIRIEIKSWIRIRIEAMRIYNTAILSRIKTVPNRRKFFPNLLLSPWAGISSGTWWASPAWPRRRRLSRGVRAGRAQRWYWPRWGPPATPGPCWDRAGLCFATANPTDRHCHVCSEELHNKDTEP